MRIQRRKNRAIKRLIFTSTIIVVTVLCVVRVHSVAKDMAKPMEVKAATIEDTIVTVVNSNVVETKQVEVKEDQDMITLARLIESEAGIESMQGKLAVGTVVMNRTVHSNKKLFGGPTIDGVIYKKGQFDGVGTKEWNRTPSDDSIQAAKKVLSGYRSFGPEVVYYYNPKISTDKAFIDSVEKVATIGRHVFAVAK